MSLTKGKVTERDDIPWWRALLHSLVCRTSAPDRDIPANPYKVGTYWSNWISTRHHQHSPITRPSPSIPTRQTELPELPFLIHPRRTELALILLVWSQLLSAWKDRWLSCVLLSILRRIVGKFLETILHTLLLWPERRTMQQNKSSNLFFLTKSSWKSS